MMTFRDPNDGYIRDNIYNGTCQKIMRQFQWVACSERLPKPNTMVFVYEPEMKKGEVTIGAYYMGDGAGFRIGGHKIGGITHWMPIEFPDPPDAKTNRT